MQPSLARPFRSSDQSAGDDMAASRRKNFGSSRTTSNLDAILGEENQTWGIGRLNPVAHCGEPTLKELRIAIEPLSRAILSEVGPVPLVAGRSFSHTLPLGNCPTLLDRQPTTSCGCGRLSIRAPLFRAHVGRYERQGHSEPGYGARTREHREPSDKENDNGKVESSRSSCSGTRHGGS